MLNGPLGGVSAGFSPYKPPRNRSGPHDGVGYTLTSDTFEPLEWVLGK